MSQSENWSTHLQQFLVEGVAKGIPGISAAVVSNNEVLCSGVAGAANQLTGNPIRPDLLFGLGSITKTFITVVILQLVEEGTLQLHHTVEQVLGTVVRGVPNANSATIAQLLNHTSGIPSWEDDPVWIREGRGQSLDVGRIWGKHDTLAYILCHQPLAASSKNYSYANTNYTLLGMMIETVTGHDVTSEIRARIHRPLGLHDIYLEGFESLPTHRLHHRYHWATTAFRRDAGLAAPFSEITSDQIDATGSNLSVEWTAGGIVASAVDLARHGAGLRNGRLLSAPSMEYLLQWSPVRPGAQVGHGVFRWTYPDGLAVVGHDGNVLGFSAVLYWFEDVDIVVAAQCNVGSTHSGEVPISLNAVVKQPEVFNMVLHLARAA